MPTRLTLVTSDPILARGLRGRDWLVGAVLGLLVGMGLYWATPPNYTATAAVELSEAAPTIDISPVGARPRLVSVDTDAQILVGDEVVSAIAQATGTTRSKARTSLAVAARPLTRVLEISFTGSSPKTAVLGAQQAAETFLGARERLIVARVQDYLVEVGARTASPRQSALLTTADISGSAESRVEGWRERAIAASLQLRGPGSVLEQARITSSADRGDLEVPLVSGACLGALLGVGLRLERHHHHTERLRSAARPPAGAGLPASAS